MCINVVCIFLMCVLMVFVCFVKTFFQLITMLTCNAEDVESENIKTSNAGQSKKHDRCQYFRGLRLLIDTDGSKRHAPEVPLPDASSSNFRKYWNEMIWLELKAWHSGRSVVEQDEWLLQSRQNFVTIVYASVIKFLFAAKIPNLAIDNDTSSQEEYDCYIDKSVKELSPCYLANLCDGMKQVLKLHEEVEAVKHLYSSFSNLYSDLPQYKSETLQNTMEDLSIWYNASSELLWSLLSVSNRLGARDSAHRINAVLHELKVLGSCSDDTLDTCISHLYDIDLTLFTSEFIKESVVQMTERQYHKHSVQKIYLQLLKEYFGCLSRSRNAIICDSRNSVCEYLHTDTLTTIVDTPYELPYRIDTIVDCIHNVELKTEAQKLFQVDAPIQIANVDFRNLPRLEPLHGFLCCVVFGVMSECLQSRLQQALACQQKCSSSTSLLTIQQLVSECREVIECSILSLSVQSFLMQPLCWNSTWKGYQEMMLKPFEVDLLALFSSYLDFVKLLVLGQLNGLPHAPRTFIDILRHEWNFARTISHKIGLADVCARKCVDVCAEVFSSTKCFLESAVHAIIVSKTEDISVADDNAPKSKQLLERWSSVDSAKSPSSPQAGVLWFHRQRSESPHLAHRHSVLDVQPMEELIPQLSFLDVDVWDPTESSRRYVFELSRAIRDMFQEVNERFIRAAHYANILRKDLECSMSFRFLNLSLSKKKSSKTKDCWFCKLLLRMKEFGCILVQFDDCAKAQNTANWLFSIFDPSSYMVFVCLNSKKQFADVAGVHSQVKQHVVHCLASCFDTAPNVHNIDTNDSSVNLVIVLKKMNIHVSKTQSRNVSDSLKKIMCHQCSWNGPSLQIQDKDCLKLHTIGKIQPSSDEVAFDNDMVAICLRGCDMAQRRSEICKFFAKYVKLEASQMTILKRNHVLFSQLHAGVLEFCASLRNEIYAMSKHLQQQVIYELPSLKNTKDSISAEINQITLRIFNIGFDCIKHASQLLSSNVKMQLEEILAEHLQNWMKYILDYHPKGSGNKPKWAERGIKCLVSMNMSYVCELTETEYENLKSLINKFLNHLIGSKDNVLRPLRTSSIDPHGKAIFRSLSSHSSKDETAIDGIEKKGNSSDTEISDYAPLTLQAIRSAIFELDEQMDRERIESGIIGHVVETSEYIPAVQLNARLHSVSFQWQRGTKIGEGTFGKVYTCVNMDNGKILAMKEVQFQAHDEGKVKDILDEMANFEGISHPNLVRYFGIELHRDVMFIFMEYCDSGTLADISQLGLPEEMIQQYTSQIVRAVGVLHHQGIVHRDIKGTNIFLTSVGLIKLGDFGSAVRLSNRTKTMPGEISSHAGITAAYTAPEVINSSAGGYGRAADIWSIGCVVIEMSTRRRPWYDHEPFQIMYKVGMGSKPPIPTNLSESGQSFVKHCLEVDTSLRWSISNLQHHPFVRVICAIQD